MADGSDARVGTLDGLERAMRFRVARQGVLAANVANADTPGYRRADLAFDAALDRASTTRLTDPRHLGSGVGPEQQWKVEREARSDAPDGNGVDFDREVIALSRNAGAFTEAANVHGRIVAMLRMAIRGEA